MSKASRRWGRWVASLVAITGVALLGTFLIDRYLGTGVKIQQKARSLRVMTWNIGKLYLTWDSRAANRDLDHVAQVIREVDPHVVALQEIRDPEQLGRLATLLGPDWLASVPEDLYDRRAGLLVHVPARFFNLPTTTGRIAQAALLTLREGVTFKVASVHLDAFDSRRRMTQAEEILAAVQRPPATSVILAGDFNLDAAVAARGSDDHRLYQLLTREMVDAASGAGPTTLASTRLDYIFYQSDRVERADARVLHGRRINIMDHDPLVVEMTLRR